MNLAAVFRKVGRVCVLCLVLEFRVKTIKVAHQVNIALDGTSKVHCSSMYTDDDCSTGQYCGAARNAQLGQATREREVKVKVKMKLVGELQLA